MPPERGGQRSERFEYSDTLPTDLPVPPLTHAVGGAPGLFLSADGALFQAQRGTGALTRIEGFPPLVAAAAANGARLGLDASGTLWALDPGARLPRLVTENLRGLAGANDVVHALDAAGQLLRLDPKTFAPQPVADAPSCVRRLRAQDDGIALDVGARSWTWIRPARAHTPQTSHRQLQVADDALRRRASLTALADGRVVSIHEDSLVDPRDGRVIASAGEGCRLVVTGGHAFTECAFEGNDQAVRVTALTDGGASAVFDLTGDGVRKRGPTYGAGPWVIGPGSGDGVLVLGPDGVAPLERPLGYSVSAVLGSFWVYDTTIAWNVESLTGEPSQRIHTDIPAHRVEVVDGGFYDLDRRRARVLQVRRRKEAQRSGAPDSDTEVPVHVTIGSPRGGLHQRTLPEGAVVVAMATVERGVAAGHHAGLLWTTIDGGETWQQPALPITGEPSAVLIDAPSCTNRACTVGPLVWFDADALAPSDVPELRWIARDASDVTPTWSLPCSGRSASPRGAAAGVPQITCTDTSTCTVSRRWLQSTDDASLLETLRVVPAIRDRDRRGAKLYGIRPGSPAAALNFKNGDMLVSVDGIALRSQEENQRAWTRVLEHQGTVVVTFERKGKTFELRVTVK